MEKKGEEKRETLRMVGDVEGMKGNEENEEEEGRRRRRSGETNVTIKSCRSTHL